MNISLSSLSKGPDGTNAWVDEDTQGDDFVVMKGHLLFSVKRSATDWEQS